MNKKIVIASILKSTQDIRTYHKIAKTIANQTNYDIHLIGHTSTNDNTSTNDGNIKFHRLYTFPRLSLKRLTANWYFFLLLWNLKPNIIIVSTFELLPASLLYKLLFRVRLGYDVQENYAFNVYYSKVFPYLLRPILYFWIRLLEIFAHPFINFYLLAEDCYALEIPFMKSKSYLLPNKFLQIGRAHV